MRNSEHPAYQRAERKLRRFAGLLMNYRELLLDDGFDCEEAGRWWYQQYQQLKLLEEASHKDAAKLAEWHAEEKRVEAELFQRMDRLIKFIYAHAPEHPWLPAGSWSDLTNFTYTAPTVITDPSAATATNRFYRAVSP